MGNTMRVLFSLFACVLGTQAKVAKILAFGDSWGKRGEVAFNHVMNKYGLEVANAAVEGTTAAAWAANPNKLREAVEDAGADYVWLTIGLSDLIPALLTTADMRSILEGLIMDTEVFLDVLFNKHPNVIVVQSGYEYINYKDKGFVCKTMGETLVSQYCTPPNPTDIIKCQNEVMYKFQTGYVDELAKKYPNLRSINLLGTLKPLAASGQPDPKFFSTDCIHLTNEGYEQYFEAMWKKAGLSSTISGHVDVDDYVPVDVPSWSCDVPKDSRYHVNWLEKCMVSKVVRNEGLCGSSYAMAVMAAAESLKAINLGSLGDFSVQQLVDCAGGCGSQGISENFPDGIFNYLEKVGICTEASYPYQANMLLCRDSTCTVDSSFKVKGYTAISNGKIDALKTALMERPVVAAVDSQNWSSYTGGIFSNCGTSLDHYVLVVGYTDNYWLVKNSFGETWGEDGYIRLAMGNTCGIANKAFYPKTQ